MTAATGAGLADLLAGQTAALLAERQVPGLAAAVVQGPEQELLTAGWAAAGRLVGPGTTFALGSLTKTFTGLLLADMAERGEVRYHDSISVHLPGYAAPPRRSPCWSWPPTPAACPGCRPASTGAPPGTG